MSLLAWHRERNQVALPTVKLMPYSQAVSAVLASCTANDLLIIATMSLIKCSTKVVFGQLGNALYCDRTGRPSSLEALARIR